jgi:FMN reductase
MSTTNSGGVSQRSAEPVGLTPRAQAPADETTGNRPRPARPRLIVGIGGTEREGSVTEACLREALHAAEQRGARVKLFSAISLALPMFNPTVDHRSGPAVTLIEGVRECDGLVLGSPAYHGGLSGLVKNALDYLEDLHDDQRPYLDGRAVGCIVCAYGGQATASTLTSMRNIVHALRGWPTPLGVTVSSDSQMVGDGTVTGQPLRARLHVLGQQVVEFARSRTP